MRGKARSPAIPAAAGGITPAYAGKSSKQYQVNGIFQDHPRVCGEKLYSVLTPYPGKGSPPRMRGKVDSIETGDLVHGITPAYAGKSGPCPGRGRPAGDHPRVCGEKPGSCRDMERRQRITPAYAGKSGSEWFKSFCAGSPPRMRGKGVKHRDGRVRVGITPAYAGKRISGSRTHRHSRDHPRVCGEKL